MTTFKRGLSPECAAALQGLAKAPGGNWWKDVLANKDLLLAVRGGYLNAYVKGQSVFKIGSESHNGIDAHGHPLVSIHYKYLIEPELEEEKPYISFDGQDFSIETTKVVCTSYKSAVTLERLVRTASRYSGPEKIGVHRIASNEPKVVDLEIAFTHSGDASKKSSAPRMDMAVLIPGKAQEPRLVFCEAKCADNVELWRLEKDKDDQLKEPQIAVVSQLAKYEKFIGDNAGKIADAYMDVCKALVDLGQQKGRTPDPLIVSVANGLKPIVHPKVYLLVYGYDGDQKKTVEKRCDKLNGIRKHRVIAKGDPKEFRLSKDILRYEALARK